MSPPNRAAFEGQQRFRRENARDRKPFKPKPWSHQRELESLKGKMIYVLQNDGNGITAVLLEADQFCLKLEIRNGAYTSVLTVFKHDLRSYQVA